MLVNGRGVPLRSILASSAFGFFAIVLSFKAPAGVFRFLIDASGCIMLIVYLLMAISQTKLRLQRPSTAPVGESLVWFFPWLSYAVVLAIAAILASMAWNPGMRPQVISSAVALAITLAVFFSLAWRRGGASNLRTSPDPAEASPSTELGI
jgi:L-asparagine transporter-like permease